MNACLLQPGGVHSKSHVPVEFDRRSSCPKYCHGLGPMQIFVVAVDLSFRQRSSLLSWQPEDPSATNFLRFELGDAGQLWLLLKKINISYIAAPGTPEAMIAVSWWELTLRWEIRRRLGWHFAVEVVEISQYFFVWEEGLA